MIRGAIDYFDGEAIGGWLHSDVVALRDQLVLAFVDQACVGAGRVSLFRQDLADAGLGDGYCGFRFGISPPPGTAPAKVVIKLENSDLILLRPGAIVIDPAVDRLVDEQATGYDPQTIAWMQERRWLDRREHDFLIGVTTDGAYALDGCATPADRVAAARRLLALYRQGTVGVQETLIEPRNLSDERAALLRGAAIPVIAIHAPHGTVMLHDGPTIELHDDRLLFIDARTAFGGDGTETARLYRAVDPAAA